MTTLLQYFGSVINYENDARGLRNAISASSTVSDMRIDPNLPIWIDRALALLSIYEVDETKIGFEINMIFAVQAMTERLWEDFQAENIAQLNSPFRSEKIGSYSYTRFDPRIVSSQEEKERVIPPLVKLIIEAYRMLADTPLSTTRLWDEYDIDDNNEREYYHTFMDNYLYNYDIEEVQGYRVLTRNNRRLYAY